MAEYGGLLIVYSYSKLGKIWWFPKMSDTPIAGWLRCIPISGNPIYFRGIIYLRGIWSYYLFIVLGATLAKEARMTITQESHIIPAIDDTVLLSIKQRHLCVEKVSTLGSKDLVDQIFPKQSPG